MTAKKTSEGWRTTLFYCGVFSMIFSQLVKLFSDDYPLPYERMFPESFPKAHQKYHASLPYIIHDWIFWLGICMIIAAIVFGFIYELRNHK